MGQLLTVTDVSTACVVVIFDCEDNYLTGCRNVSRCQQLSHSGLCSPRWSCSTYSCTINIGWPILLTPPPLPPTHPVLHPCLLSWPYLLHYLLFHFPLKKKAYTTVYRYSVCGKITVVKIMLPMFSTEYWKSWIIISLYL